MKQKVIKYFTIYDNTNDEIIAYGTREECAARLNLTPGSFASLVSNAKNQNTKKCKRYSVVIEIIDTTNEETPQ